MTFSRWTQISSSHHKSIGAYSKRYRNRIFIKTSNVYWGSESINNLSLSCTFIENADSSCNLSSQCISRIQSCFCHNVVLTPKRINDGTRTISTLFRSSDGDGSKV